MEDAREELKCSICLGYFHDAVSPICGHTFCRECIVQHLSNSTQCPLDRIEILADDLSPNILINNLLSKFKAPCDHEGCEWVGLISDMRKHLGTQCMKNPVDCRFGCGFLAERKETLDHQLVCDKRLILCTNGCGEEIPHNLTSEHDNVCLKFPVSCENGCYVDDIGDDDEKGRFKKPRRCLTVPRSDLDLHYQVCPREVIRCTYASMGCTWKSKRSELNDHLQKDVVEHSDMAKQFSTAISVKPITNLCDVVTQRYTFSTEWEDFNIRTSNFQFTDVFRHLITIKVVNFRNHVLQVFITFKRKEDCISKMDFNVNCLINVGYKKSLSVVGNLFHKDKQTQLMDEKNIGVLGERKPYFYRGELNIRYTTM